tara:strand:+ start:550 stop:753 length:204 start_codon:yes stop_codon:yes gene_type:complete
MAVVNVLNVTVLDNPSRFTNPFQFEITFDCLRALPDGALFGVHDCGACGVYEASRPFAARRSARCAV